MKVPYLDINLTYRNLYPGLKKSFDEVLKSGRIVLGPRLEQFEENYAKFSTTKYAIGVGSGLDAITLSLEALGVSKGDEVVMASNAYIAAVISVLRVGAKPVFVEPKDGTFNINPSLISDKITTKTKAIIPVHFFGQACKMDEIMSIARKHNLLVVEDNAQSHGAKFNGKITGSFGDANATSFYPTKNLAALGEGGAVTTNNKKIHKTIKKLRNYGEESKYNNVLVGYNSRLDELQAAFLDYRLKMLSSFNKKRQIVAQKYFKGLSGIDGLDLPEVEDKAESVFHIFAIKTKKRDKLQQFLLDKKIATSIHYPTPPYLQKGYSFLGYKKGDFPIAEKLARNSLSLPIYPEMSNDQIYFVISSIKSFYN